MNNLENQEDLEKVKETRGVVFDSQQEVGTFEEAGVHPRLLEEIANLGWKSPTPVQQKCLPYTLKGRDVAGFAQTGTGKTGVFLITVADRILKKEKRPTHQSGSQGAPLAIILAPTRELAMQIDADASNLFGKLGISSMAVFGGVDYEKQARQIREGIDVIVATPGRLKDYFQKKVLTLNQCEQFVCDEADRMFDMGFIEDVEYFLDKLGENIQKLLFSATTNEQVKELAFEYLESPEYISVNPETITPENIEQHAIICESKNKLKVMLGLLKDHNPTCSIIFTNTKMVAEWLHYKLTRNGIEADLITGDLPQRKRINLIHRIKEGKIKALIATDVASRGLHISNVSHVYNFDIPDEPSNYVHRIGRTARAGAYGKSYSLVCEDYGHNLEAVKTLLGDKVDLPSEWHDDSYLAIPDAAGNPFKDPDFKGSTLPSMNDRPARGDRGDRGERGERGGRGEKPARGGARGGKGPEQGDQRRDRKGAEGRHGRQQPHDRDRKHLHKQDGRGDGRRPQGQRQDGRPGKGPRHHDKGGHPHKPRHQQPAAAAAREKAAPAPASVGGMLKKMFSVLFGSKKKKES